MHILSVGLVSEAMMYCQPLCARYTWETVILFRSTVLILSRLLCLSIDLGCLFDSWFHSKFISPGESWGYHHAVALHSWAPLGEVRNSRNSWENALGPVGHENSQLSECLSHGHVTGIRTLPTDIVRQHILAVWARECSLKSQKKKYGSPITANANQPCQDNKCKLKWYS